MPSGTSRKADGDDLMRQHWRSIDSTISAEHYMSDSASSAGLHKKGSARAYVQATYPASSLDRDGKIHLNSANSRVHILRGSGITNLIAGAPNEQPIHYSFRSGLSPAVAAQRVHVSIETTGSRTGMYYGIVFDEAPIITVSVITSNPQFVSASVLGRTASTFGVQSWVSSFATAGNETAWMAHIVGYVSNMS